MKHDEGKSFRGAQGFRQGLLMFLGIPLDLHNDECIRAAVNTFGKFHHWIREDPYLVRTLVFASFPEDILLPRDVVFMDYAAYGGAKVSWTTPCYILGANFAEQMPQDEDLMPINGNPHLLPGVPFPEMPPFILPPFPALGWNDVPPPPPAPAHDQEDNWGNWDEPAVEPVVEDQESMVFNDSAQQSSTQPSSDVQLQEPPAVNLVGGTATETRSDPKNIAKDVEDASNWAIVVYQPPVIDVVALAQPVIKVPFGPPLPPEMIWRRSFENLLNALVVFEVPKPLLPRPLSPIILSKRN